MTGLVKWNDAMPLRGAAPATRSGRPRPRPGLRPWAAPGPSLTSRATGAPGALAPARARAGARPQALACPVGQAATGPDAKLEFRPASQIQCGTRPRSGRVRAGDK
ncbi:hypothetical protein GCM10009416_14350 [Craurococcus roseus]|uniref:Uncharacterized protein n=1 Tax=Craurococcus roseus TaxID=77585 RepID=A0ABN1EXL4_9PROT